jgi:hypothetical protein
MILSAPARYGFAASVQCHFAFREALAKISAYLRAIEFGMPIQFGMYGG